MSSTNNTLTPEQLKKLYNVVYAEVGGGSPEEVMAVASTILNRLDKSDVDRVLKGFSSYTTNSKEYQKASQGTMNPYEQKVYQRNAVLFDKLMSGELPRGKWTHFDNINAFGEPSWAAGQNTFQDIGRQRFYVIDENPRVRTLKGGK